jgi:predicted metalloendopeptidase
MLDNSTSKVDIANFDAHHFKEKLLSEPMNILSRRSPLYASKRREFCADSAGKQFADSVNRFYVLSTFGGSKEKIEIEQYVNDLQTSWLNHLPSVAWLDDETKTGAIEKVKVTDIIKNVEWNIHYNCIHSID